MQGASPSDDIERIYATKSFEDLDEHDPPLYTHAIEPEMAVLIEAKRLTKCHLTSQAFHSRMADVGHSYHCESVYLFVMAQ